MSGSHRRSWWLLWLLTMTAVLSLGLVTVPVHASPGTQPLDRFSDTPGPPPDPSAMVAQVGPVVVDIDTQMGYQSATGAGTGIVIDPGGQVMTNNHVIEGATDLKATDIGNGQTYGVDVLGYDRSHDVALLQLRGAGGLPTAVLGDSSQVAVGDPVVAMGNAGGQGGTPSAVPGHVIALGQTVSASDELTGSSETLSGLIAADTPIRPGDSGGPMVNNVGQVIGMNTAASGNYQMPSPGGRGFAIPIGQAMPIVNEIRASAGSATVHIGPTAFLGVGVADAKGGPGAEVQRVLPGTPAAGLGLSEHDVIVSIDNAPVNSATALTNIMDQHHPGDTVQVGWHGNEGPVQTGTVTLAAGPPG